MRRYRILEHTADIGLVAYGRDLPEAFANAAYGLFSIITEMRRVRELESREVAVNAQNQESLLFNWMNQLIYIFEIEHLLFRKFDIIEFNNNSLKAICRGERYNPTRHILKLGVKSATYHLLKVDEAKNQVRVIFDV